MRRLFVFLFVILFFYSNAQTDSLNCIKINSTVNHLVHTVKRGNGISIEKDYSSSIRKIESILTKNAKCFKTYKLSALYMFLAEKLAQAATFPEEKVTFYLKKAILMGAPTVALGHRAGLYTKTYFPERYKEIEHLSDSMYIINCNKFINVHINLQIGFLLRYMIRKDQSIRTRISIAKEKQKSNTVLKQLLEQMNKIDSINELLLKDIFINYGYPGWSLVGSEGGDAVTLMFHMSPKFKLKYIHLIEQARKEKEIFIDDSVFKALVDRTLLQNFNVSFYNSYESHKVIKDKSLIKKYRHLLQLSEK